MATHNAYVVPLALLARNPEAVISTKAMSLSRLHALGLPVPETFCVTTAAFHAYLAEHALDRWLEDELRRLPGRDQKALRAFVTSVRDRFDACPLPDDLARELRSASAWLAGQTTASPGVRRRTGVAAVPRTAVTIRPSSAVDDDRRETRSTDQFQARLNVLGDAAIDRAIRAHWAARFSKAALAHRALPRVTVDAAALIVQRFVDADRTAIVFSADPHDDSRSNIVIDATWGLASTADSELVSHDTFVVARSDRAILQRRIPDKAAMIVPLPDGDVDEAPVPMELTRIACLGDEEVCELAALVLQIERALGYAVVVECAFEGVELFVLDCRPLRVK